MMQSTAWSDRQERSGTPIRVLLVDDSAVARAALTHIVEQAPEFAVIAALNGAQRAIDWLATNAVDIVLLDLQMPGLDGIAALPDLISACAGARILVVSTLAGEGARATVQALALGATDTLAKPGTGALGRQFGELLIDKMLRLGRALRGIGGDATVPYLLRKTDENPIACLAVGASTGGLHALSEFFAALPQDFDAPILVTQHLPTAFMPFFADQLQMLSGRPVFLCQGGEVLRRGHICIAPGDRHLGVRRIGGVTGTVLLDDQAASRCCPSVDPMLSSTAAIFGSGAMAVILTGMGRDGEIGAGDVAAAGGTIIVQDQASSAVWGMPGSVARAGLASLIAAPSTLAEYVARRGSAA